MRDLHCGQRCGLFGRGGSACEHGNAVLVGVGNAVVVVYRPIHHRLAHLVSAGVGLLQEKNELFSSRVGEKEERDLHNEDFSSSFLNSQWRKIREPTHFCREREKKERVERQMHPIT